MPVVSCLLRFFSRSRRHVRLLVVICVMLAGVVSAGCVSLDVPIPDCVVSCNTDCPSGMACRGNLCVSSESAKTCASAIQTGGGGASGLMPPGAGDGGFMNRLKNPPPLSEAGTGALTIAIHGSDLCTGKHGQFSLSAAGGVGSYLWQLLPDQDSGPSLTLSGSVGDSVVVSGVPMTAGTATFTAIVTDGVGVRASKTVVVQVFETPTITTSTLPLACSGHPYSTKLAATGGEAGAYAWSVNSKDASLTVKGNVVSLPPSTAETVSFTATVDDGHCSASADLQLELSSEETGECPSIDATAVIGPCVGNPYPAQTFYARGGTAPFVWSALSLPSGVTFDAEAHTVAGTPTSADPIVVSVADSERHEVSATIEPRATCRFAFISTATGVDGGVGPPSLQFFDPILGTTRTVEDIVGGSASVADFKFSPDGHHLVYRTTSSGGNAKLVMMSGPDWRAQALAFAGNVQRYAWSPDSSVLAVAYQSSDFWFLGGVRLTTAAANGSTDAGAGATDGGASTNAEPTINPLTPVQAPVGSDLLWFSNDAVAFHVGSTPDALYYERVGETAFAPLSSIDTATPYSTAVWLQTGNSGVFAADPSGPDLHSYANVETSELHNYYGDQIADPSGKYVAQQVNGQLQIFQTGVPGAASNPWKVSQGSSCKTILSWAADEERIACADLSAAGSKVSIFNPDGTAPLIGTAIPGTSSYTGSAGQRRLFSPSGRFFAFTTSSGIYLSQLSPAAPSLTFTDRPSQPPPSNSLTDLAFSPDETQVLWQYGSELLARRTLADPGDPSLTSVQINYDPAVPPTACNEDFASGPGAWCGSAFHQPGFSWSADSRFAAAIVANGSVEVWDLADDANIDESDVCVAGCGNEAAFQP